MPIIDPMELTQQEVEYFRSIDFAAQHSVDRVIGNSLPLHACYLINKLFSMATTSIRLFSGELRLSDGSQEIYESDELIVSAGNAVQRGVTVQILTQNQVDFDKSDLIQHMRDAAMVDDSDFDPERQAALRTPPACAVLDPKKFDIMEKAGVHHHFMVMDSRAYRIEIGHHPDASGDMSLDVRADANFGNRPFASGLARLFDKVKPADWNSILDIPYRTRRQSVMRTV